MENEQFNVFIKTYAKKSGDENERTVPQINNTLHMRSWEEHTIKEKLRKPWAVINKTY